MVNFAFESGEWHVTLAYSTSPESTPSAMAPDLTAKTIAPAAICRREGLYAKPGLVPRLPPPRFRRRFRGKFRGVPRRYRGYRAGTAGAAAPLYTLRADVLELDS